MFYFPFHTRWVAPQFQPFYFPSPHHPSQNLCVHSTSGSWTSCSLYLQFVCSRSWMTGYFSSFRSQLKYHLHKGIFLLSPYPEYLSPIPYPFQFKFYHVQLSSQDLPSFDISGFKKIYYLYASNIIEVPYKQGLCLVGTMSLATRTVPAQSWSSINICWMNTLILHTLPKCHFLCESPVISPSSYQNSLSWKQEPYLSLYFQFPA